MSGTKRALGVVLNLLFEWYQTCFVSGTKLALVPNLLWEWYQTCFVSGTKLAFGVGSGTKLALGVIPNLLCEWYQTCFWGGTKLTLGVVAQNSRKWPNRTIGLAIFESFVISRTPFYFKAKSMYKYDLYTHESNCIFKFWQIV